MGVGNETIDQTCRRLTDDSPVGLRYWIGWRTSIRQRSRLPLARHDRYKPPFRDELTSHYLINLFHRYWCQLPFGARPKELLPNFHQSQKANWKNLATRPERIVAVSPFKYLDFSLTPGMERLCSRFHQLHQLCSKSPKISMKLLFRSMGRSCKKNSKSVSQNLWQIRSKRTTSLRNSRLILGNYESLPSI